MMSLEDQIGQMLVFGWQGASPAESRTFSSHARALIDDLRVSGVILMDRNVVGNTPNEIRNLTNDLREAAQSANLPPLLLATDQEGGRVSRFRPPHFPKYPTPQAQGATRDPLVAYDTAKAIGDEMKTVGINWPLMPVLDVNNNPKNPIIGDRSYGDTPELVTTMGVAAMQGMQEGAGLPACGKHFPGHGDTETDSHLALPTVRHARERLDAIEFAPFQAAINAGLAAIMTTHILFPVLDDDLPATLSPKILTELLRRDLDFNGVVITDCLEMKGITNHWGAPEAAVLAAIAGADLILACHTCATQYAIKTALIEAARSGRLSQSRIDESLTRITKMKERWIGQTLPASRNGRSQE